jgi:hypothetical protein
MAIAASFFSPDPAPAPIPGGGSGASSGFAALAADGQAAGSTPDFACALETTQAEGRSAGGNASSAADSSNDDNAPGSTGSFPGGFPSDPGTPHGPADLPANLSPGRNYWASAPGAVRPALDASAGGDASGASSSANGGAGVWSVAPAGNRTPGPGRLPLPASVAAQASEDAAARAGAPGETPARTSTRGNSGQASPATTGASSSTRPTWGNRAGAPASPTVDAPPAIPANVLLSASGPLPGAPPLDAAFASLPSNPSLADLAAVAGNAATGIPVGEGRDARPGASGPRQNRESNRTGGTPVPTSHFANASASAAGAGTPAMAPTDLPSAAGPPATGLNSPASIDAAQAAALAGISSPAVAGFSPASTSASAPAPTGADASRFLPAAGNQAAGNPGTDRSNDFAGTSLPAKNASAPASGDHPAPAREPAAAAQVAGALPTGPAPTTARAPGAPQSSGGANFAASPTLTSAAVSRAAIVPEKKSLGIAGQQDKTSHPPVGISAAQASPAMSPDTPNFAAGRLTSWANSGATTSALVPSTAVASPAGTAAGDSARLAVDAVVKVVDAQAGRSEEAVSAVSLNFKFGSDDLAIRVEWHDGEVHTQFRTDSPELRDALASQWQTAAPSPSNRMIQFAAPSFSSSGDATANAGGGQDPRQSGHAGFGGQDRAGRGLFVPAPTAAAPAAAAPLSSGPSPLATVLHLHTFA